MKDVLSGVTNLCFTVLNFTFQKEIRILSSEVWMKCFCKSDFIKQCTEEVQGQVKKRNGQVETTF